MMNLLNRRHFIKLAASGLLVAASPAWSLPAPKKKLGVALLGLGNYSTNLLAPALQDTKFCELRGIITGSPEKVPQWQKKYNIKDANVYSYETMDSIANNDDIDIIYIVTPTGTHKSFSVQAANTGKHVWCEKPMAMDEKECQEIIDACNKNGVKLAIGYRMQHEPNTRTFGNYRDSQPYGAITSLSSFSGYAGSGRPADNWRMQKDMGGGALYDMGVYAINGARYMTGKEPLSVTGRYEKSHPDVFKEVDETTYFTMDFGNDVKADCGTSVVKSFNHLKTECEKGWYELEPMQQYTGVTGKTSDGKRLPPISKMQQTLQMDNDAQAILGTGPALVTGAEGLADIQIVNAIFKAADTGNSVSIG